MDAKAITLRLKPFINNKEAAEKAAHEFAGKTSILVDVNNDQVYYGDEFNYYSKSGNLLKVAILSLGKPGGKLRVKALGDDRAFGLRPESLQLRWKVIRGGELEKQSNASNTARQKRKQEQAEAINRFRAAKAQISARDILEQIHVVAKQYRVDWEALRRHRDHLIAQKVGPDTTDAEIDELCETHETSRDRLKTIRLRKARGAWQNPYR